MAGHPELLQQSRISTGRLEKELSATVATQSWHDEKGNARWHHTPENVCW